MSELKEQPFYVKEGLPQMFFNYAYSGKAKCKKCEKNIVYGQSIFVFEGNLFHDYCSQELKDRINIKDLKVKQNE